MISLSINVNVRNSIKFVKNAKKVLFKVDEFLFEIKKVLFEVKRLLFKIEKVEILRKANVNNVGILLFNLINVNIVVY